MANLNVETLNKIVQSGDIEGLFAGSSAQVPSSASVERAMKAEGLHPSPGVGSSSGAHEAKGFGEMLRDSMDKVNLNQVQADTAIKELVAGRNKNIHETMLTIERADTSLKLMMQVRNKILDAYREVMRMQV